MTKDKLIKLLENFDNDSEVVLTTKNLPLNRKIDNATVENVSEEKFYSSENDELVKRIKIYGRTPSNTLWSI